MPVQVKLLQSFHFWDVQPTPRAPSSLNNGFWVLYTLQLHSPGTYYLGNWEPEGILWHVGLLAARAIGVSRK